MLYKTTFNYDVQLIRRAITAFWMRSIGIIFPIAIIIVGTSLVVLLAHGNSSWIVGMLATVILFAAIFSIALYFIHYRNALAKLHEMGTPQALFLAEESSFSFTSEIGTSTLKWSSIIEIWRFQDFWLLFFSKAQFVTMPLSSVPPDMQLFILQKTQEFGGKIVG